MSFDYLIGLVVALLLVLYLGYGLLKPERF